MLGSLARLQAVDRGWRLHGCSTRPYSSSLDGRLCTTATALDEADRLLAFTADGAARPVSSVLG